MVKIDGKWLIGGGIVGFLFLAILFGGLFIYLSSDDGDEPWKSDTAGYTSLDHDVVDDEQVAEDTDGFIPDVDDEVTNDATTDTEDPTPDADNIMDTNDDSSSESTTSTTEYPDAPLMKTPTFFKVQSAIPTSQAYWAFETVTEYPVLEGANIKVYQDIPNIDVTNYKTEDETGETGYTSALDLESNDFSAFGGVDGKAYVLLTSEHIASSTGKLGYTIDVPETKNSVKVLKVIPDTYGFSTIMSSNDGLWSINNADNLVIEEIRPCAASSSWGWNLASFLDFTNEFDVYLSTKSNGDWKKQTIQTTDALDTNGQMHLVLKPQILTSEQGYTGTPYDMETTGSKTFYVKFQSGLTSQIFKVTFDLSPTSITDVKMVNI